jgi:hypothetical protein
MDTDQLYTLQDLSSALDLREKMNEELIMSAKVINYIFLYTIFSTLVAPQSVSSQCGLNGVAAPVT